MADPTICDQVLMTHDVGLHARPSVKLTKLAKTFHSRIELAVAPDGPWVDAKSIVKVMATKACKDTVLHFRAEGQDARDALDAIIGLISRDFDDAVANAGNTGNAATG